MFPSNFYAKFHFISIFVREFIPIRRFVTANYAP